MAWDVATAEQIARIHERSTANLRRVALAQEIALAYSFSEEMELPHLLIRDRMIPWHRAERLANWAMRFVILAHP